MHAIEKREAKASLLFTLKGGENVAVTDEMLAMQRVIDEQRRQRDVLAEEALRQVTINLELTQRLIAENNRLRERIAELEAVVDGNG